VRKDLAYIAGVPSASLGMTRGRIGVRNNPLKPKEGLNGPRIFLGVGSWVKLAAHCCVVLFRARNFFMCASAKSGLFSFRYTLVRR
jgi:hypothetical protein